MVTSSAGRAGAIGFMPTYIRTYDITFSNNALFSVTKIEIVGTYIHTYIYTYILPTAVTLLKSSSSSPPQPQKLFGNPELIGGKLYDASKIVVVRTVSALPELGNMYRLYFVYFSTYLYTFCIVYTYSMHFVCYIHFVYFGTTSIHFVYYIVFVYYNMRTKYTTILLTFAFLVNIF